MLEQLKEMIVRIFPAADPDRITESTRLVEDLGLDSLAMMMLSMELEETFHFHFREYVPFETVGDVCGYLECRV